MDVSASHYHCMVTLYYKNLFWGLLFLCVSFLLILSDSTLYMEATDQALDQMVLKLPINTHYPMPM